LLAFAVSTVLLGYYVAGHLGVNSDTEALVSEKLPWHQDFLKFKAAFPQLENTILIVIDGDTPEQADIVRDTLRSELRSQKKMFPAVYEPDMSEFLEQHGLLLMDTQALADLGDRLVEMQPLLGSLGENPGLHGLLSILRKLAEQDDLPSADSAREMLDRIADSTRAAARGEGSVMSWQALIASDRGVDIRNRRLLAVKSSSDFSAVLPSAQAVAAMRKTLASLPQETLSGVDIRLTGETMLGHEEMRSVLTGSVVTGGAALVTVIAVLFWALGSLRLVIFTVASLLVGLVFTSAFAAACVGQLNIISIAFAVLYIGLSVDFSIHYLLRYREDLGTGAINQAALRAAAGEVGVSLILSAVTTSVGFFAFLVTDFDGVAELGLIGGVGMYISLLISLTLLPALLTVWPGSAWQRAPHLTKMARAGALIRRHPGSVLLLFAGMAVIAVPLMQRLQFDGNPMHLRDPASESVRTFDALLHDRRSPLLNLSVLVGDLESARHLAARLEALPEVANAISVASFLPDDQSEKLAILDDLSLLYGFGGASTAGKSEHSVVLDQELPALLTALRAGGSEPWRVDLASAFSTFLRAYRSADAPTKTNLQQHLASNLTATLGYDLHLLRKQLSAGALSLEDLPDAIRRIWIAPDGHYRVDVSPAGNLMQAETLQDFLAAVVRVAPHATGIPVLYERAAAAVVRAFQVALSLSLVAIVMVLLSLLGRVSDVVMILVPLLLAAMLTAAGSVLFGLRLNFANVVALPLLFGVGVDSGIHMVRRIRTRGAHENLLASSTARAMWFAALTTIVSFGNMAFSPHRGTASMGVLLTLGMTLTVACTLAALPALLYWRRNRKSGDGVGKTE